MVKVEDSEYGSVQPVFGGPEYESLATLGSYVGVGEMEAVLKANELCNRYGLDSISAGATVAWAMETYENGLLPAKYTEGVDLRFGNGHALLYALEAIALRRGPLGELLADGSEQAARRLANGSDQFLITVKGQEAPAHMPQVKRSLALLYAVNPFGADHMSAGHDPDYTPDSYKAERLEPLGLTHPQDVLVLNQEKVEWMYRTQLFYSLMDSLNLCMFDWGPGWQLYGTTQVLDYVEAVTGWAVTIDELMAVGERRLNMMRQFNAREGIDRAADKLPKRLLKMLEDGVSAGLQVDPAELEAAKDAYYAMAGWDVATGTPLPATLERLGLGWTMAPTPVFA